MSTGQTLLAIGALILLMNVSLSIHRSQINSLSGTLDHQIDMEAVNFGQSLMETVFYYVNEYGELDAVFDNLYDVTDPNYRLEYPTVFEDTLYATIGLSGEKQLVHNVTGRQVTIRVYKKSDNDEYNLKVEYRGAVNPIW